MNARPNFQRIDALGQRLGDQAFRTLISLCPEIKTATPAHQEAVCTAMRAKVAPAIDSLLEDARLAPCLAEAAFQNAVLTLALAACGGGGVIPSPGVSLRALDTDFTSRKAVAYSPYRTKQPTF